MKKYDELTYIIGVTKVTRKGVTTIPSEIRSALKISEGDRIVWKIVERKKETFVTISKV